MESKSKREMEIRAESLSKGKRLVGYCAEHNGEIGMAIFDGKEECLGFISLQTMQTRIKAGPYIEV